MSRNITTVLFGLILSFTANAAGKTKILALGDSLTFGYGVNSEDTWPNLLSKQLDQEIINGGTSGATTAFGLPTLLFHLKRYKPDLVLYALGANDALRGIDPKVSKENMRKVLEKLKASGIPVLILGMKAPPNYGNKFPQDFEQIYPELAKEFSLPLYPFLLEGVAGQKELNQPDGIHPNAAGYRIIADKLYNFIKANYEPPNNNSGNKKSK